MFFVAEQGTIFRKEGRLARGRKWSAKNGMSLSRNGKMTEILLSSGHAISTSMKKVARREKKRQYLALTENPIPIGRLAQWFDVFNMS